jgi:hypothetical protein
MSTKPGARSKPARQTLRARRRDPKKSDRAAPASASISIDEVIREIRADPSNCASRPTFTSAVKSNYDKLRELGGPADLGLPDLKRDLSMYCDKYPLNRVGPVLARFQKDDTAVKRHWPWAACAISLFASERQRWTEYDAEPSPKDVVGIMYDIKRGAQQLRLGLCRLHNISHRLRDPTAPSRRGHLSWLDAFISQAAADRTSKEVDDSGDALLSAYEAKYALIKQVVEIEAAAQVAANRVDKKLLHRERGQSESALPNFVFRSGVVWRSLTGRQPSANKITHHHGHGPKDPDFVLFVQELAKLGKIPPPSRAQVHASLKNVAPSIKAQPSSK